MSVPLQAFLPVSLEEKGSHCHGSHLLISNVAEVQSVHVVGLYVSDASLTVHGRVAGCPSRVDDDDIFGWEAHLRAVCLSGFPS